MTSTVHARPKPPATDLSGLTASEARALFLVAGPASAATPEVKAALRKLVRALPEPFRDSDAGLRTFRVDRMSSVEPTGDPVVRPEGFDLAEAWRMIAYEVDRRRTPVLAHALVRADSVWICRAVFGNRVRIGPPGADGRVEVELRSHSIRALAGELGGLGGLVEVMDPPELREALARVGAELVALYGERP